MTATVWRTDPAAAMLHQQAQLTTEQQADTTRQVLWREQQADQVLTIQEDRWRLWSLEGGAANVRPLDFLAAVVAHCQRLWLLEGGKADVRHCCNGCQALMPAS